MLLLCFEKAIYFFGALLLCYQLYFAGVALWGVVKKHREIPRAVPQVRFACVIAARNEAAVIGQLVDSLQAQAYPHTLFRVFVAPNNCTDNTAEIALAHGAEIFLPSGKITGKGEVLTQVVDKLLAEDEFDAMCVFDADNLVDAQFLQNMNDAIADGAQVVQGFRDSKNPDQSAMSGCYSIGYWLVNQFYNHSRSTLGLSALVNGSGFAVTKQLLTRLGGWHTTTMTEDYEFSAQCACVGERVRYAPDARIYDEQPLTFAQSWKQRRRWTTGSLQGFLRYHSTLWEQAVLRRSSVCVDMYLTFLMPLTQLLGLIVCGGSIVIVLLRGDVVMGSLVVHSLTAVMILLAGSAFGAVAASSAVAAVAVAQQRSTLLSMGKSIAVFWVFLGSFLLLTLLSFIRQKTTWDPIAHTAAKSIGELAP